jgi:hypothetical protein
MTATALARRVPILKTLAAVLVVNLALTVFLVHQQAGAAEQTTVKVGEGKPFSATYPAIPFQNPVLPTAVKDPEPGDCELPVSFCDVIPVEVQLPADYDPELFYIYTTVAVNWLQPPDTNDLDMYFYKLDEDGEYESAGGSATGAKPEQASTEAFKFWVVVNNFSGVNDGYSMDVKVTVERLGDKPFELLEPVAAPLDLSGGGGPPPPAAAPAGASFSSGGISVPVSPAFTSPTGVDTPAVANFSGTERPALADVDFAPAVKNKNAIIGESAFGGDPVATATGPTHFAPASVARDVPTSVLLLWLVLLPVVLVFLAGSWLLRRGSARLSIA